MKLHYSQTRDEVKSNNQIVLLPYEITLFSNENIVAVNCIGVLLPYEITLFSNLNDGNYRGDLVLLPYEITLFSNCILSALNC